MCIAGSALLLASGRAGLGATDESGELLATATSGHRTTVESIETLYTKIQVGLGREGKAPNSTCSALYWRDRDVVRLRETKSDGTVSEYKRDQGAVSLLFDQPRADINPKAKNVGMLIAKDGGSAVETDAWDRALLTLPVLRSNENIFPRYSLAEAARQMRVRSCSWAERNGHKVVEIRLRGAVETAERRFEMDYAVYLDPNVNWLAREIRLQVQSPKLPDWDCAFVVAGFVEAAPSIYFPTSVRATYKMDGAEPVLHTAEFGETVINKRPKLPFSLDLPIPKNGVYVTDRIKGVTYQSDATGRPVGTPGVLREVPPLPTPPADPDMKANGGASRLFAWVAAAAAATAVLVYLVRRHLRGRRATAGA